MDFDRELGQLAERYAAQGYQIVVRPGPSDLPPFASDFRLELCGRRGPGGVLVAVRADRTTAARDNNLSRYAEQTGLHPEWRFDLVLLEAESAPAHTRVGDAQDLQDLSADQIEHAISNAERAASLGFVSEAILAVCAALEAIMRQRLKATGENVRRMNSREMGSHLYSSGLLSGDEFRDLDHLWQIRNRMAHGFATASIEPSVVTFLGGLARRLAAESLTEAVSI